MENNIDWTFNKKEHRIKGAHSILGTSGAYAVGGYLIEDEEEADLSGQEKYLLYSNMLVNTSIVSAGVRFYLNLLTGAKWKVHAKETNGKISDKAQRFADLIEDMMTDMITPWHRVIRRAGMYRFYGFSIQEWTAKRRKDGVIGYSDIMPRPQSSIVRWDLDPQSGIVNGMYQEHIVTKKHIHIPRAKVIYMVDDSLNDTPEGLGIFRNLVEPNKRLSRYEQLEGYGFESDLRGIPMARAPFADLQAAVAKGDLSQEDMDKKLQPFIDFMKKHNKTPALGIMLDSLPYLGEDDAQRPSAVPQWDLSLLKAGATSQESIAHAIQRVNQEIARLLGVEGMLLGANTLGSQALSSDKSKNFAMTVDSALTELSETFKRDFVLPIFIMNGWDLELMPTLSPEAIQFRDIKEITGALKELADAGAKISPSDPVVNNLRSMMGLTKTTPATILTNEEALSLNQDKPEDNPKKKDKKSGSSNSDK